MTYHQKNQFFFYKLELNAQEKARQWQATSTGGEKPQLKETFPEGDKGRVRDKIASQIGIGSGSGKRYK